MIIRAIQALSLMALALVPGCVFSLGSSSKEVHYVEQSHPVSDVDFRQTGKWVDAIAFGAGNDQAGAKAAATVAFGKALAATDAEEAEADLERSLAAHPSAATLNNLGCIRLHFGDHSAARAYFRGALAIDPTLTPAQRNLEEL